MGCKMTFQRLLCVLVAIITFQHEKIFVFASSEIDVKSQLPSGVTPNETTLQRRWKGNVMDILKPPRLDAPILYRHISLPKEDSEISARRSVDLSFSAYARFTKAPGRISDFEAILSAVSKQLKIASNLGSTTTANKVYSRTDIKLHDDYEIQYKTYFESCNNAPLPLRALIQAIQFMRTYHDWMLKYIAAVNANIEQESGWRRKPFVPLVIFALDEILLINPIAVDGARILRGYFHINVMQRNTLSSSSFAPSDPHASSSENGIEMVPNPSARQPSNSLSDPGHFIHSRNSELRRASRQKRPLSRFL